MFIEIKERSMYDNLLFYFFHLKKCRIREHFLEMKKKKLSSLFISFETELPNIFIFFSLEIETFIFCFKKHVISQIPENIIFSTLES